MLTEITPSQEHMISDVCARWAKHGLSCKPADRERAEHGVDEAYRSVGLEPPREHIWSDSPLSGIQVRIKDHDTENKKVKHLLNGWREQYIQQVHAQVLPKVRLRIRLLIDQYLHGKILLPLRRQIWDQLSVEFPPPNADRSVEIHSSTMDGHLVCLFAEVDVFRCLGVENLGTMNGHQEVTRNSGWWWPLRDAVILTDRPELLLFDQDDRLHCETGPALRYRDGFIIYSWHGITVPPDLIERGWDAKRIFKERNVEIRRCAIERIGWEKFVEDANLTQVGGSVPDPGNPGQELSLFDVPETIFREPVRVLLCTNGTPERDGSRRRFGLTVPADIPDPLAAAAWTYDVSPEKYAHTARRA